MSLRKRLVSNGVSVIIQKFVRIIEHFVLVPFFISSWGSEYYGEWLTLTIVPSIIALSDLGFGSAAASEFVLRYSSGDEQKAVNILKSAFIITSILILFCIFFSAILVFILNDYGIFNGFLIKKEDAIPSILMLIIAKLLAFYTQIFEAYFRASRKANLSINLMTSNTLLNIGAGIIVLVTGSGVVIFSFIQLIIAVVFNILYGILAKKIMHIPKSISGVILLSDIKIITKQGLGYFLSPVWQSIYFQGTTLAVRIAIGTEAVTIYNTVRTATRSINQLFNMIDTATFPEIQFEVGINNFDKVKKLFRVSMWASFILALFGFLFLSLFGLDLYNIWTKHKFNIPNLMWFVFTIGILFNSLWWTGGVIFRAYNKPFIFTFAAIIASSISVFFTYILSLKFSLIGAAMGTVILDLLMVIYVLPASCNFLKLPLNNLFLEGFKDFLSLKENIKFKKI